MGQFDEAFAENARSRARPALRADIVGAADIHKDARQYDRTIELCQKALELDAGYGEAFLQRTGVGTKDATTAPSLTTAERRLYWGYSELIASLGHAYAVSGKRDEARKMLGQLLELSRVRCVDSALIAAVYGALGEHDEAFRWIEQAFEDRSGVLVHAKVEPILTTSVKTLGFPECCNDSVRRLQLTCRLLPSTSGSIRNRDRFARPACKLGRALQHVDGHCVVLHRSGTVRIWLERLRFARRISRSCAGIHLQVQSVAGDDPEEHIAAVEPDAAEHLL
jgi:tetratricopeptide (TPR) repeat protein